MEDGHRRDQGQGEEGVVPHGPQGVKERWGSDQIHLEQVEGQAVVQEGLEVGGLVWILGGGLPEVRVVPCSVGHSERAVGHWEEGEEALQVFLAGVGSYVAVGGLKIHCVAQGNEGQSQILQMAVDQSYEHQVAEPEA